MAQAIDYPRRQPDLQGSASRHSRERVVRGIFFTAAAGSLLVSVFIVASLFGGAIDFLSRIELSSLWAIGWFPRRNLFDLLTLFLGTAITTGIAIAFAGPIGLGAAIYLAEYAPRRVRTLVKPILEILAGVPSVVLGFFALTFISPEIVQVLFPGADRFNLLAAGIAVGILIIPLIASVAEDAMRAVPRSLREASYGLGARRVTTSLRVVVPAAISGIMAAFILGISRGIGETMILAIAAGGSGGATRNVNPLDPGQTITAAIASLATGTDRVRGASAAFPSLYFLGLLLFAMTLVLNVLGDAFVRRTRQRY
jgi:phosphate transport system permease protein